MPEMMDISPDTHFLESIRADRGSYTALLAEAIDNSFDAGSTEIVLEVNKKAITMQDNGIGITKDRQGAIVRLGEHGPMPTTALGTFGIGLKYHAISVGNTGARVKAGSMRESAATSSVRLGKGIPERSKG